MGKYFEAAAVPVHGLEHIHLIYTAIHMTPVFSSAAALTIVKTK